MPRLSNCPFCESKVDFWRNSDTGALDFDGDYVKCTNDKCDAMMGPVFLDEGAHEHLALKWNRRPAIQKARRSSQRANILTAGRLEDNKLKRRHKHSLTPTPPPEHEEDISR